VISIDLGVFRLQQKLRVLPRQVLSRNAQWTSY